MDGALRVHSAEQLVGFGMVMFEAVPKTSPDLRVPFFLSIDKATKDFIEALDKVLGADSIVKVVARLLELRILDQEADEEMSLGCGASHFIKNLLSLSSKAVAECDTDAMFGGGQQPGKHADVWAR